MSKIIAWLILIFVVLLALRMISMRNNRARRRAADPGKPVVAAAPMVRCAICGVFLPRAEARTVNNGFACADGQCAKR
jgi:uncharacterized membrane protein YfcA